MNETNCMNIIFLSYNESFRLLLFSLKKKKILLFIKKHLNKIKNINFVGKNLSHWIQLLLQT